MMTKIYWGGLGLTGAIFISMLVRWPIPSALGLGIGLAWVTAMALGSHWRLVSYVLGLVEKIDNRRDWAGGLFTATASYLALTIAFNAPLRTDLYIAGVLCCYSLAKLQCIRARCCGSRRIGRVLQTLEATAIGCLGIACFLRLELALWAPILYLAIRTASFRMQDRARTTRVWVRLSLDTAATLSLMLATLICDRPGNPAL